MAETQYLTVDAPVSPCRILSVQPEHEAFQLGGCWSAPGSWRLVWVGPTACDQSTVPADHGRWFHDQQHLVELSAVEGLREHGEHATIGRCEPRLVDLALEHSELMAQGQNLGVAVITGHDQQSETGEQQTKQPREQRKHPPEGRDRKLLPTCCDAFSAGSPFPLRLAPALRYRSDTISEWP